MFQLGITTVRQLALVTFHDPNEKSAVTYLFTKFTSSAETGTLIATIPPQPVLESNSYTAWVDTVKKVTLAIEESILQRVKEYKAVQDSKQGKPQRGFRDVKNTLTSIVHFMRKHEKTMGKTEDPAQAKLKFSS